MQTPRKDRPKVPQIILLLRAVAGAYLLYLAWGLRGDALSGESLLVSCAAGVFVLAGAALLITSVRLLARGEFLRPWETPDDDSQDEEE